jgi:hypothetical protein
MYLSCTKYPRYVKHKAHSPPDFVLKAKKARQKEVHYFTRSLASLYTQRSARHPSGMPWVGIQALLVQHTCISVNPSNAELNPFCHLLALLGAHPILHVSRIRVNIRLLLTTFKIAAGNIFFGSQIREAQSKHAVNCTSNCYGLSEQAGSDQWQLSVKITSLYFLKEDFKRDSYSEEKQRPD